MATMSEAAFNLTKVELKSLFKYISFGRVKPFNLTKVELKYFSENVECSAIYAFNLTKVELKCRSICSQAHLLLLLI